MSDIVAGQRAAIVREEEKKQQEVDVDIRLVLKRQAGRRDVGERVETQREAPEGGVGPFERPRSHHPARLKNWTSRSCLSAAAFELKVPRLRRLPVLGLSLRE